MLKGTNNEKLIGSGLKEEHLLFYQIWKELTESKTFDTYQYKSVNILNGICELVHDIESYLDGNTHTMHTIDAMREELLALIKRDSVMVGEFPSLRNRLLQSLSKKLDSTSRLKGLWYQLKYVYSKLESAYDEALTKKLVEAIETGADTQYQLTAQYISRCVDMGWFVKALSAKADTLKQEPARSKEIDSFLFKLIKAQKQNFSVFAPFRLKVVPKDGKSKEEYREAVIRHLSSFGIEVKTGIEIEGFCVGIEKAELKDTQQYMVVQTQAYDVFSAAHFSIIGLSEVLNTLSFFTAIESWSVSDISLEAYAGAGDGRIIDVERTAIIIKVLSCNWSSFEVEDGGFFTVPFAWRLLYCVDPLLKRMDSKARASLMCSIFENEKVQVSTVALLLQDFENQLGRYAENARESADAVLPLDAVLKLEAIFKERAVKAIDSKVVLRQYHGLRFLWLLEQIAPETAADKKKSMVTDDVSLVKIIDECTSRGSVAVRIVAKTRTVDRDRLSEFVDLGEAYQRVKKFATENQFFDLPRDEQMSAVAFILIVERGPVESSLKDCIAEDAIMKALDQMESKIETDDTKRD